MRQCPTCGFPLDRNASPSVCPKCDEDLIRAKARRPLVVDLAHRGETATDALAKLERALSECLWHGHPALKIIHGHGSSGAPSRIKPIILNALNQHARRLGATLEPDGNNPGAHILRMR